MVTDDVGFPGGSDGKASACTAGDPGLIPGSERSRGEGNGNPLQYPCLENPMDRGAWWATVHGVAESRTRLSDFTSFLHGCCQWDDPKHILAPSVWFLLRLPLGFMRLRKGAVPQLLSLDALQETRNTRHSTESSCGVCLGTKGSC